jgi:hypothetical protein
MKFVENAVEEGFVSKDFADKIFVISDSATDLLDQLATHNPPVSTLKWLNEDQI